MNQKELQALLVALREELFELRGEDRQATLDQIQLVKHSLSMTTE